MPSPRALPLGAAALTVLLAVAGCGAGTPPTRPGALGSTDDPAAGLHGPSPDSPTSRPSFVLRDTGGASYDFAAQTRGRPTLLYFGYTHCPDECPTAMADVAAALRSTDRTVRAGVRVVFVTTDPARDTPPVLRRWLDRFGPGTVGLTGTQAQVDAAQRAVGVEPGRREGVVAGPSGTPDPHPAGTGASGGAGYAVTHENVIFGYDRADRLPVLYPGGVTPADIATDLPLLDRPPAKEDS